MRVVVAMSGGVDSSVAAGLLAEAGHDVVGVSMQLYDQRANPDAFGSCGEPEILNGAHRRIGAGLGHGLAPEAVAPLRRGVAHDAQVDWRLQDTLQLHRPVEGSVLFVVDPRG